METEPNFESKNPEILFTGVYRSHISADGNSWDIHPNGNKFLMIKPVTKDGDEISSYMPRMVHFDK